MNKYTGKSVFGGIAIGKIMVYEKGEHQVKRADGDAGRDEQGVYHPDGAGEVVALHEIPDAHGEGDAGGQYHQGADDGVAGLSVQQMAPQNADQCNERCRRDLAEAVGKC